MLIANTFLGGSGADHASGIAVDVSSLYVVGYSTDGWGDPQRDYNSGTDAFAAKINLSGGALTWNTFLGGGGGDDGYGIIADWSGEWVMVSGLSGLSWSCTPTACTQRTYTSSDDAFVAKVDLMYRVFLPLVQR